MIFLGTINDTCLLIHGDPIEHAAETPGLRLSKTSLWNHFSDRGETIDHGTNAPGTPHQAIFDKALALSKNGGLTIYSDNWQAAVKKAFILMSSVGWQPQAIIFDMDGLLVDSESVWHIAESDLIESRGHTYGDEVRKQLVGMRMDEFMAELQRIFNLPDSVESLYAELTGRMLALIPHKVAPQPGAPDLVTYVVRQNTTRAIASSSPLSIIDAILASQGWNEAFPVRSSADDDPNGKPAPDVYLRTAHRLGIDPADCLALEDSPNGARAAVAAGMTCYAVPDRSHTHPNDFNGITEHLFDSLHAVLANLQTTD